MWIQFTFDVHGVYVDSIHIQTKSSVKGPKEIKATVAKPI